MNRRYLLGLASVLYFVSLCAVSAMLAKIFEAAGFKTGLFISPFVIDFRERIQINGEFISEKDLIK